MDIGAEQIKHWHVHDNGWSDIGYHDVIRRNGAVEAGRPVEKIGAHVSGRNSHSIGICLVGGYKSDKTDQPHDHFTEEQMKSLRRVVMAYMAMYPDATVHGHNEFANKGCPGFDVQAWMSCTFFGETNGNA